MREFANMVVTEDLAGVGPLWQYRLVGGPVRVEGGQAPSLCVLQLRLPATNADLVLAKPYFGLYPEGSLEDLQDLDAAIPALNGLGYHSRELALEHLVSLFCPKACLAEPYLSLRSAS